MVAGDVKLISANQGAKKAVVLDGTDDYFSADAFGAARVVTADLVGTFCGWINPTTNTGSMIMISLGDWSAEEYMYLGITTGGKVWARLYDAGATNWEIISTTGSDLANGWHHIALVHNGTRPILYLDGALETITDTVNTTLASWISVLGGCDITSLGVLGMNGTLTSDFNGAIGEVKYYNKVLTAAEILSEFNGVPVATTLTNATDGVATGLISWWKLNGDYVDSISAHNGTAVNQAYLDPNYSELTQQLHLAWVAAGDKWDLTYADGQLIGLHVEGV